MTRMGPISHADRCDGVGQCDEFIPGLACGANDLVVGFEDAVGEPVGAQELPDVFDRVEFRRARRQQDQGQVLRDVIAVVCQPARSRSRTAWAPRATCGRSRRDGPAWRRCRRRAWRGPRRRRAPGRWRRTDRRSRSAGRPAGGLVPRLAHWRTRPFFWPMRASSWNQISIGLRVNVGEMRRKRRREVFLNAAMVSPSWPGWRGRALICEKPRCFRSLPIVRS